MKFFTSLPGLTRFVSTAQEWEADMTANDFQFIAQAVEVAGFDSISIPEHICLPTDLAVTMGAFWPHAMTVMAFVAGATKRIAIDSCVIVMPYHHPVVFAKAVSTLDVLSGGRVRLTVGVGHAEQEFEVIGVPFHERGRIADEYLAAMIELWTSDEPEFKGDHVSFDAIAFEPKPVQRPYPPILVGGDSRAAMRRAARHDGWFPVMVTPSKLPRCLDYIRSQPEFAVRSRPWDLVLTVGALEFDAQHRPLTESGRADGPQGKHATIDAIGALEELGVTWTSVPLPPLRSIGEYVDHLHWIGDEIISSCR
jgi:probable F420-dependent oxidoreductase